MHKNFLKVEKLQCITNDFKGFYRFYHSHYGCTRKNKLSRHLNLKGNKKIQLFRNILFIAWFFREELYVCMNEMYISQQPWYYKC